MHNTLVFVYGTLRKGGSNHFRLAGAPRVCAGTVRGSLFRIDWYPGVLLDHDAGVVLGEVYEIDAMTLAALDAFEGAEYLRVRALVAPDDGGPPIDVWIWEYRMPVDGLLDIPSGDWLEEHPES